MEFGPLPIWARIVAYGIFVICSRVSGTLGAPATAIFMARNAADDTGESPHPESRSEAPQSMAWRLFSVEGSVIGKVTGTGFGSAEIQRCERPADWLIVEIVYEA